MARLEYANDICKLAGARAHAAGHSWAYPAKNLVREVSSSSTRIPRATWEPELSGAFGVASGTSFCRSQSNELYRKKAQRHCWSIERLHST